MIGRLRFFQRTAVYQCRCLCHHSGEEVRVRFAPSPTGEIHLGGLRTALYNYLFARANNGTFILRIEDTDQTRLQKGTQEKITDILKWVGITIDEGLYYCFTRLQKGTQEKITDILKWVGITIDEGPDNPGDYGPYIQRKKAYRCFCSERRLKMLKKEALLQGETPKYDNNCRHLNDEEIEKKLENNAPFAIRFKLDDFTETWPDLVYGPISYNTATIEGDPVILKSDGFPTYHFANVVDDHFMRITHVLRGQEWLVSTTKHILMYNAFDWSPPQFAHLPLLLGKGNKKLSKRQGDFRIQNFKDHTYFPETILNLLTENGSGFKVKNIVGMNMKELIDNFDLSAMNRHSSHLNVERAMDINKVHLIRKLSDARQRDVMVQQFLEIYQKEHVIKSTSMIEPSTEYVMHVLEEMALEDLLKDEYEYLWSAPDVIALPEHTDKDLALSIIRHVIALFRKSGRVVEKAVTDDIKEICEKNDILYAICMKVLRRCLTPTQKGPSIGEIVATLGRNTTLQRLEHALKYISDKC
ncbi:hypothetical protein LSH36_797g01029 [Paralvinella palmiformis]|uniref:Nondiscriminating glutamyl-tRNA synthetase EARS2, mitochondrial n=1 Tax=Paralvinella palmiformis TaxID=53620 RepID=A0AAD9J0S6_9ANNE|nr:hypothetical protein LSH36_797g01029 [Paralvinella palmiformis]